MRWEVWGAMEAWEMEGVSNVLWKNGLIEVIMLLNLAINIIPSLLIVRRPHSDRFLNVHHHSPLSSPPSSSSITNNLHCCGQRAGFSPGCQTSVYYPLSHYGHHPPTLLAFIMTCTIIFHYHRHRPQSA